MELRQGLSELSPVPDDPPFSELWEGLLELTNLAGTRLLEPRQGEDLAAAAEVQAYLFHLEKVSRVGREAPLQVPLLAARSWRALARYVDATRDREEIIRFLLEVPSIGAALSDYSARVLGRHAAPLIDVLTLMVRAGSVYQDALRRTASAQAGW